MFFDNWSDFFAMGGYGFYVWLAYAVSFIALLLLTLQSYRAKKRIFAEIRHERQRAQRLQTMKGRESL
ncbi:heme exporter protein D [Mesocricetibacter intestinalis]|uniref:Heme exporter protein D n=1 Tax=Mesocricetibacter intestinalis TaxID=1521930 RepID=A0A4V6PX05_9PAST|nr:heme exporter protein CcmD [Mesocricetibacter intestinalis]TDQ59653.1 heme exporter protein D [Mesocricetibacter intestinalis]